MKRHNKERRRHMEDVPEIFKDLWGFNFVEELSLTKTKGEEWPKIRVVISGNDEDKIKKLKVLLQKYEFPFSNLKIIHAGEQKEEIVEKKPDCTDRPEKNKKPGQGSSKLFKVDSSPFKFKCT